MRTLIHLSDLHFGRVDTQIQASLIGVLNRLSPDLITLSGDLTQRARTHEFHAAQEFLARLSSPWIAVPGNHDVPLLNPIQRFFQPFKKYRQWIHGDLNPRYEDDEMLVLGVNTAHAWTVSEGRLTNTMRAALAEKLQKISASKMRILICHHPLENTPHHFDLILSGHLHKADAKVQQTGSNHSTLLVQAGTATSTRYRGEKNSFNHITLQQEEVMIQSWLWDDVSRDFTAGILQRFARTRRT